MGVSGQEWGRSRRWRGGCGQGALTNGQDGRGVGGRGTQGPFIDSDLGDQAGVEPEASQVRH